MAPELISTALFVIAIALVVIVLLLVKLLKGQKQMADFSKLNANVTDLQGASAQAITVMDTLKSQNTDPTVQPQIDSASDAIAKVVSDLNTAIANDNPTPTPTPAPTPTPTPTPTAAHLDPSSQLPKG